MKMARETEKTAEFLTGEDLPQIVVRPILPFEARSFRVTASGHVDILGDNRKLRLELPDDDDLAIRFATAEAVELLEFDRGADKAHRELILTKV